MKNFSLFLLIILLASCASTVQTPYGQKKAAFNPMLDTDCVQDKTVSGGTFSNYGYACANDNGIQFIRHTLSKFNMTKTEMDARAQRYCDMYDRNAVHKGKANMVFVSKIDWTGVEYLCLNK